jgi:hypothetical protein
MKKTKKRATGGDIGNVVSSVAPLLSLIPGAQPFAMGAAALSPLLSMMDTLTERKKPTGGSPGAYNTGGDISLNSQSTQIKGNPNVYDSETYDTPNGKIKLDHNEVIKGTFAYSNRLRNPKTGNTFAEDIAPIEKSSGRAAKRGRINDPISNNTISVNEQRAQLIARTQEILATKLGHRTPQGMDPQNAAAAGYQTGGPITPSAERPYMSVGGDYFYDPYDSHFLRRNPLTGSYTQEDNPGFGSGKGFRPYQEASPTDWEMAQFGQEGVTPGGTLPEVTISGKRNVPAPRGTRRAPSPVAALDSLTRAEEFTANPALVNRVGRWRTDDPAPELGAPQGLQLPYSALQYSQTAQQEMDQRAQQVAAAQTLPAGVTPPSAVDSRTYGSAPTAPTNKYGTTVGDVFQAIEVGSKFGQLVGGPEKETPHLDRSQISKQAYDPRPVLQRNQANFQAQSNALQTSSPNLRRALQNSLYAKKLEADSGVLSKYQEMNNQATTQYEDRISNRARYNNQVMTLTDDMNARNRGQFMNASQNAMTSLGNFGEALNRKKQNYDALNILRTIYPDVYGRIGSII